MSTMDRSVKLPDIRRPYYKGPNDKRYVMMEMPVNNWCSPILPTLNCDAQKKERLPRIDVTSCSLTTRTFPVKDKMTSGSFVQKNENRNYITCRLPAISTPKSGSSAPKTSFLGQKAEKTQGQPVSTNGTRCVLNARPSPIKITPILPPITQGTAKGIGRCKELSAPKSGFTRSDDLKKNPESQLDHKLDGPQRTHGVRLPKINFPTRDMKPISGSPDEQKDNFRCPKTSQAQDLSSMDHKKGKRKKQKASINTDIVPLARDQQPSANGHVRDPRPYLIPPEAHAQYIQTERQRLQSLLLTPAVTEILLRRRESHLCPLTRDNYTNLCVKTKH